jgi:hypothetical protein
VADLSHARGVNSAEVAGSDDSDTHALAGPHPQRYAAHLRSHVGRAVYGTSPAVPKSCAAH